MNHIDRRRRAAPDTEAVIRHLRAHPDILLHHPELLRELRLADDRYAASSLLERQVALLRARVAALETAAAGDARRYQREREAVSGLLSELPLIAISADTETLPTILVRALQRHAGAGPVFWYLFQDDATGGLPPPCRTYPRHHPLRDFFAQVFNVGRPLVDSLQAEHRLALFGAAAAGIRASLLVPLSGDSWEVLLAVGSPEADRYRQGLELLAIRSLASLAAMRLHAR